MALVSEISNAVDEITVDVNGSTIVGASSLLPSLEEGDCRLEQYRVMRRFIKTIESSVDKPDLNELLDCGDLEGAQVATGFVGDAVTHRNYDFFSYVGEPLQFRDCWSNMYGGMGSLGNGGTRKSLPFDFIIETHKEKLEDSDVEGGRNDQEQNFQRNALLASGTAFLTLGGTVISAVLTAGFENKSSQSKALAKLLCISSIALGVLSMVVMILAFRCGQRGHPCLQVASSISYTLGLLAAAVILTFGILAVAGL